MLEELLQGAVLVQLHFEAVLRLLGAGVDGLGLGRQVAGVHDDSARMAVAAALGADRIGDRRGSKPMPPFSSKSSGSAPGFFENASRSWLNSATVRWKRKPSP